MKQVFALIVAFSLLSACKSPERGAPEIETLSKKLFDTFRSNDMEKMAILLPDKGTFRKIEAEKNKSYDNIDAVYDQFLSDANSTNKQIHDAVTTWDKTKYLRSTNELMKEGKLTFAKVSTKFDNNNEPYKIEFTAAKFNNRWYYYGDAQLMVK